MFYEGQTGINPKINKKSERVDESIELIPVPSPVQLTAANEDEHNEEAT